MSRKIHVYLVSDSTGETVAGIAKSVIALFEDASVINHHYPMFRNKSQLEELKEELIKKPGIVLGTILNNEMNDNVTNICEELNILYIPVLDQVIVKISNYLNEPYGDSPGKQHELNEDYYLRINALSFTLAHDDGQNTKNLDEADVIFVGVSRSSKSPTSIYLANKGIKCANVPFVKNRDLPKELYNLKKPLIIGLVVDLERLLEIRKSRLVSMNDINNENYVNYEEVYDETAEAKKIFRRNSWPIIDVTKRSIEETAALVLRLLEKKEES